MKKLFMLLLSAASLSGVVAQTAAETKAWQEFMTPGDMHSKLARSTGKWKAEITIWMAPGSHPATSSATAKGEMTMGGRYLQSAYTGEFMDMPFEGRSVTGYVTGRKCL